MQQLRQSLKLKWLAYYEENHSWLAKLRIWAYYGRVRRPKSGFILGILSTLEPQLTEMLSTIVDLNNDPDSIITAFGLNFNPEQELELIKSNQTPPASEDSSNGKASNSQYYQNNEAYPSNISDRQTLTSEIHLQQTPYNLIPQGTPQIAIAEFIPVPSNLVTQASENHQPIPLPLVESPIATQSDCDVSNDIVTEPDSDRQPVTSNGAAKPPDCQTSNDIAVEPNTDRQLVTSNGAAKPRDRQTSNSFKTQPAALVYDRQLLASSISVVTQPTSDRQPVASNRVTTQPVRDRQPAKSNGFGTSSSNGPVRKVIKMFNSLIKSNPKTEETQEHGVANQSNSSPPTQATNLPSWIDESCQGAGWDRRKDR